jgi:hypothetical protein
MTLLELLQDLSYGEFQQLKLGNLIPGEFESEPDPTSYSQFMSHVNLGLNSIYKRFFLSSKEIYIQQYEEIEEYIIHSRYAESNTESTEPTKYIQDSVTNPFEDDLLKIEQCYDEAGTLLFLNDPSEDLSIFTPTYRSIQIPWPNEFNVIAVQYRADHPRLKYVYGMDPETIEVMVPNALQEALIFYIANRAFGTIEGQEGQSYFMKYENSCKGVEKYGLQIQGEPGDWRFDQHGWV